MVQKFCASCRAWKLALWISRQGPRLSKPCHCIRVHHGFNCSMAGCRTNYPEEVEMGDCVNVSSDQPGLGSWWFNVDFRVCGKLHICCTLHSGHFVSLLWRASILGGSGTHRARTVHLFYLDNLPDAIVLLCCCSLRCRVAEPVPHFTLHALRTALYMLFLGL